jgi:hypothetical protein
MKTERSKTMVWFFIVTLFLIVVGFGLIIIFLPLRTNLDPELMMGILIVFSIATLMTVLFLLAAGFSSMNLTDPKQALGLPEGSIRAMIALVLIMVFILFGIFLFRKVGLPSSTYLGQVKNMSDLRTDSAKRPVIFSTMSEKDSTGKEYNNNRYDVWVSTEVNDEGKRLAQQLITTVGTLVVSIASFYFGSTISSGAAKKERETILAAQAGTAISNPIIKDITPKEGSKGQEIGFEIVGTGFNSTRAVRLIRGSESMEGTEILSNFSKVQCKIMVDKEPDGKWDIVIENGDGNKTKMTEIFTIKQS